VGYCTQLCDPPIVCIWMDSQLVEMLGRHRLIAELLRANLEVAIPARDRGIDLIAYADLGTQVTRFSACPIQLKAAVGSCFSIDKKYAKFPNLLMAYVWHVADPVKAVTYATTFSEAKAVADAMGYTNTASWERGLYVVTKPGPDLLARLEPFRMTSEEWWRKVTNRETADGMRL
jgi:hypothetical protein